MSRKCIKTIIVIDPALSHRSFASPSSNFFVIFPGFAIRLIAGHEATSCESLSPNPDLDISRVGPDLTSDPVGSLLCASVFALTFYFSMAACMWWVVMTVTWFMSVKYTMIPEAFER